MASSLFFCSNQYLESLNHTFSTVYRPRIRAKISCRVPTASSFGRNPLLFHEINCSRFSPIVVSRRGREIPGMQIKNGLKSYMTESGDAGEEEVEGEDGELNIADNELRETIKKSKEVLAIQKLILRQISERRNIISSIRSDVVEIKPKEDDSLLRCQSSTSKTGDKDFRTVRHKVIPDRMEVGDTISDELSIADMHELPGEASLKLDGDTTSSPGPSKTSNPCTLGEQLEKKVASQKEDKSCYPLAGEKAMNVIFVAAECAPWSKTGGLGDVSAALPKALSKRGHRVMVVVPQYKKYKEATDIGVRIRCMVNGQDMEVAYFHAYIDGVDFVFVDSPIFHNLKYNIYGGDHADILRRMVLFCKAAVEVPWHVPCGGVCYGDGNLVFIANDWHTALLPVYLKAYYRDRGFMKYARCVLVIHNIAHQGRGPLEDFKLVDLPGHYMNHFKVYDPVGGCHFNIFAAGLKTANHVVAVSCGYSWELKTLEGGWGLHGIINEIGWKFSGIVNGIDADDWNPETDLHLQSDGYANYTMETLLSGKAQCKSALQRELGLPVRDIPILSFIGRLDHQKGVDIIGEAMSWIASQDVQVVMLGTGRPDLEEMLRRFEREYHDKVRGWVGFSVKTAHRITAGADVLMMPSRFEPCGLNQLYAMMYGTVPVVHAVGGLRDTVLQFDPYKETGLGWAFERAEANMLIDALRNCMKTYRQYKRSWEGLQKRAMMQDLSWDNAAERYEEVLIDAKYQW